MRSTTLQNGWRDSTEAPALGMGPLTWHGQRRPSWPTGGSAGPADRAGTTDAAADDAIRVEAARVWQAVDNLTDAQRTAVTLRFGSDLPIADIAGQMGRTEGAVKLLLNRGLAAVRNQLAATRVAEDRP